MNEIIFFLTMIICVHVDHVGIFPKLWRWAPFNNSFREGVWGVGYEVLSELGMGVWLLSSFILYRTRYVSYFMAI